MRKVSVLCIVLWATGAVLAQVDQSATAIPAQKTVRNVAVKQQMDMMQVDATSTMPDANSVVLSDYDFVDYGAQCPQQSFIIGQDSGTGGGTYFYSDLGFCSGADCRRVTAENFPPKPTDPNLTQPIRCISWYGSYIDSTSNGCVKPAHSFRIQFYNDDGTGKPNPNSIVATFNVTATARVVDTINWSGGGAGLKYLYWVTLPSPVSMARGHFSICGTGSSTCWFLWGHSTEGNMLVYRWWDQGNTTVTAYTQNDVAYCFGVLLPGACCNDWSGVCNNNSDHFTCHYEANLGMTPPGGRFTTGNCASLDPLCGQMPGACCKADETCVPNMTRTACEAIPGAYWRGPQTTCNQCCWIPDCPTGAHVEQEPCGQNTNGGCQVSPNRFETITLQGTEPNFSATVCGTLWADDGLFDEDWYEFTANQQFRLTIQNVNTQIPIRCTPHFNANHGPPTCTDLWYYVDTLHDPCVVRPAFTPPVFPRGTYWMHISPEDANGPVNNFYPCNTANEYYFEILVEYVTCPNPCNLGAPLHMENEPNYCVGVQPEPDTFNSGCDKTPPGPYLPITDDGYLWCGKSGWYEVESGPAICRGDMNCSGAVDFADINAFVLRLSNPSGYQNQYPNCPNENGDINEDGQVNFGDINPFVKLLSSNPLPIPCPSVEGTELVPDTDWYRFTVTDGPKTASIFLYAEFPVAWELYQASAGCGAPPLEHHDVVPCEAASLKTFCLPNGTYWLRIVPDEGVECGKEYALGLEEFLGCSFCSVTCPTPNVPEAEPCGQDTNGGCNATPNVFEDIQCNATICASLWADGGQRDTDWFRLVLTAPRYLIFTVHTEVPVLTGFMDTAQANCSYLYGYWVNVESCTAEPESWYFVDQGVPVQFAAGTYWWLVLPDDGDPIWYSYPCNRPAPFDLNTYWFSIECTTTPPGA